MIEKKDDKKMAKTVEAPAKFTPAGVSGDCKAPAKTPWGASLRNSLPVRVLKNGSATIKFGVSCDRAVLVYPHANLAGLQVAKSVFVAPGEEISVDVSNMGGPDVEIPESTMLVNVVILPQVDFDFVR